MDNFPNTISFLKELISSNIYICMSMFITRRFVVCMQVNAHQLCICKSTFITRWFVICMQVILTKCVCKSTLMWNPSKKNMISWHSLQNKPTSTLKITNFVVHTLNVLSNTHDLYAHKLIGSERWLAYTFDKVYYFSKPYSIRRITYQILYASSQFTNSVMWDPSFSHVKVFLTPIFHK